MTRRGNLGPGRKDALSTRMCVLSAIIVGLTIAGCQVKEHRSEMAPQAGILTDCVLFEIQPPLCGYYQRFNDFQRTRLAEIFSSNVFYEEHLGGEASIPLPGRVYCVIAPGQRQSLSCERCRIWGFFPEIGGGRLPSKSGEAVILEASPCYLGAEQDIEGSPRALRSIFTPSILGEHRLRVVGITSKAEGICETVYVPLPLPSDVEARQRASALLPEIKRYDLCREKVVSSGLEWEAIRIRDKRVDKTWGDQGKDYRILEIMNPWIGAHANRQAILHTRIRVRHGALPVKKVSFEYDGSAILGHWKPEPLAQKLFKEQGVLVSSLKQGNINYGICYGWETPVPWRDGQHSLGVLVNGRLESLRFVVFHDEYERSAIVKTLKAFQEAFRGHEAAKCLGLLTPELRQQYGAAFRSGEAFRIRGKSNQAILDGSNAIEVLELRHPRARARYYTKEAGAREQVGVLFVDLEKREGFWRIASDFLLLRTKGH